MDDLQVSPSAPQSTPRKQHVLLKLFLSTLYLSAFTFGGGFVIVTLMKKKFVDELHWIGEDEMLNLVAIAQSSPGAIAVNGAILVGYKIAGAAGALVSILGTVIPPLVILSVISLFYEAFKTNVYVNLMLKGMQAGVAAVILDVVLSLGANVVKERSPLLILIMILAFIATYFLNINVILIILAAGLAGFIRTIVVQKKQKGKEA